ncbi:hypothetical protein Tco_1432192, partial [Tanacetum coccineum]
MAYPESSSMELVISNNDLLTEILVRLPTLSLVLFKSISKRWSSLIKEVANVTFRHNLDPLSGLFLQKYPSSKEYEYTVSFSCDFVPFDTRIPLLAFGPEVHGDVKILDSCNGLLLCCSTSSSRNLFVNNPSISNMFKVLPEPDISPLYKVIYNRSLTCFYGLKMAFDPTKSPLYKVIYAETMHRFPFGNNETDDWVQIHTFSSETGNWSLCGHHFSYNRFDLFGDGVYWNDAIYWANFEHGISKLDIINEHPVLTVLPSPYTVDGDVHYSYSLTLFESRS